MFGGLVDSQNLDNINVLCIHLLFLLLCIHECAKFCTRSNFRPCYPLRCRNPFVVNLFGLVKVPTSTSSELLHSVTARDEVKRPAVGVNKLDMLMQVTQHNNSQQIRSRLKSNSRIQVWIPVLRIQGGVEGEF